MELFNAFSSQISFLVVALIYSTRPSNPGAFSPIMLARLPTFLSSFFASSWLDENLQSPSGIFSWRDALQPMNNGNLDMSSISGANRSSIQNGRCVHIQLTRCPLRCLFHRSKSHKQKRTFSESEIFLVFLDDKFFVVNCDWFGILTVWFL